MRCSRLHFFSAIFGFATLGALPACSSNERESSEGTTTSSALTMQAASVRDFGGKFVVGDGMLYRLDQAKIYTGEINHPETDRVLAQVPTEVPGYSDAAMLLTPSHLVFWSYNGAWRVPRGGGPVEPLPRTEYPHSLSFPIHADGNGGLVAFGYNQSFYNLSQSMPLRPVRDGFLRIDHLAADAAAWVPLVSSTALTQVQGWSPGSDFVYTDDFTFANGKIVGIHHFWGPYVAEPGTNAFQYLGRGFWDSHRFGYAKTSFALRGSTLHVLVGARAMRQTCADASALVTFDITGAHAPTVITLPAGGVDLVVTGDEAYFQSDCTDDVYRVDLSTRALTNYPRPVASDDASLSPQFDEEMRRSQKAQHLVADGGNVYFAHDKSIRSIPAH